MHLQLHQWQFQLQHPLQRHLQQLQLPKSAAPAPPTGNERVVASPLAKKLAEKLGLQLNRIPGSGEGGRVVKRDVENFKMAGATGMPAMTQEGIY